MQEAIIAILNSYGYLGVFLLIMIENVFPPIPSEVILTFGGFMTHSTRMTMWGVVICATLGSVAGAVVLYLLGRFLSVERLERLFDSKLGKILRLKKEDVKSAEKWFVKRGNKAVFFCRFIPIVRSLISIPAGVAKMRVPMFLLLTTVGTFIWNVVLVYLGRVTGDAWDRIAHYIDIYSEITLIILAVIFVILAAIFVSKRFKNQPIESVKKIPLDKDKLDKNGK
ncbi:MAG: DedA family protein [Clostridiales bacterium]|jgi:membrane protein DedA with SNARE-associated domain|nr:DedA family protein [Clostridiales bacterium]